MSRLVLDFRHAARALVRNRLVTTLAVLAFALGIGVTTAVFSIFNGVLLTPLPFPNADEIVVVYDTQPACSTCPASFPKYYDWKSRNHVFAAMGGSNPVSFVLTGAGDAERVAGMQTTASLVDVFGVKPYIGRWYSEAEDQTNGRKVAVLAYAYWNRRWGRDPHVLGRSLVLNGDSYEVIGVMPESFTHRGADLFVPEQRKLDPTTRGSHFMQTYARLKKGVTVERATVEMRALGESLAREFGHNHGIDVRSYYEVIVGSIRRSLQVLLGAVFLVLLIACANVANLLLAAGLSRRRELAIRLALGASPTHLARQLTSEGILLATVGGAIGILLAVWAVRTFVALAGNQLPRAATIAIDGRVLAFTAIVSLLVGVCCGLWPLARLRAAQLATAVREGDMRTGSGSTGAFGSGLVVTEVALAFALLVGSGLLVKNLILLQKRDTGFRADRVVTFDLAPAGPRYQSPEQVQAFYRDLYQRLSQIEGVEHVGFISHLPMYRFGTNGEMSREGGNPWGPNEAPLVEYRWMYGEYLKALGIPLLQGRLLDERDLTGSNAVLINHAMATKFWPGENPIGKRFGQGSDKTAWHEVVGVVGDTRSFGLVRTSPYEFYRTIDQSSFSALTVVMRSRSSAPSALIPAARQIVRSMDSSIPVSGVQTMDEVVAASVGQPRLLSALSGTFGALAGLLAMVGVYGVMSYNVRRQRREFGIRLALGADRARVRNLVVRRGLVLAGLGVAIGAVAAWLLTRTLTAMLNDVQPTDPVVFAATAVAVIIVAIIASYLPARSAGRVDPVVVLRDA